MSRIFDALRRAGMEQSGLQYPDTMSVVNEVLETGPQVGTAVEPSTGLLEPQLQLTPSTLPLEAELDFPELEADIPADSRLVFWTQPSGLAFEKFRFLNVRLRELRQTRQLKRLLITSSIPEEGKTMVSANLTGALARKKGRVLLIDGDMRRPALASRFGLGPVEGLAEWLLGSSQKPGNIYHLKKQGFWFMPAGAPPERPLELMQSGRLHLLLNQLSDAFDWVVIDSPPLLPLADTSVWMRFSDGVLLVARQGISERSQLERSLEVLKKEQLLGLVMNSANSTDEKNYYQRYGKVSK
jgi:capsular exopolysaccharide synthesis family protein